VYALRGDRDWRRSPQLTGSRQVSQLAVQAYKLLEAGDATIATLKHTLGREVTEAAVLRAITELWQQLRIIPVISAPGEAAKWQLLRHRYQKAIAEGASTSQVTAISVLASIYLQAVIAASMEEVELFLAPLTARSKVREVLRGLVATRQIHTLSVGHAPHFYVAGTLPAFTVAPTLYASSSMSASSYFMHAREHEEDLAHHETHKAQPAPYTPAPESHRVVENSTADHTPAHTVNNAATHAPTHGSSHTASHTPRIPAARKPAPSGKPPAARPHFSRPAAAARNRKPGQSSAASRPVRRAGSDARPAGARPAGARPAGARPGAPRPAGATRTSSAPRSAGATRPTNGQRWSSSGPSSANGKRTHSATGSSTGTRTNGGSRPGSGSQSRPANGSKGRPASGTAARGAKPASWSRNGHSNGAKPTGKPTSSGLKRQDKRADNRKPALTAGAKAGNSKRYGFTARPKPESKKRG
jgi:hypothetical protein